MSGLLRGAIRAVLPERWRLALADARRLRERLAQAERVGRDLARLYEREAMGGPPPEPRVPARSTLNPWELKLQSQGGEDGVLLRIFSLIGTTDRRFVEFGCGEGTECNSAALALYFGWRGLLMDANSYGASYARHFYDKRLSDPERVVILNRRVLKETLDSILEEAGFTGPCDLLSIDVDGNDYWLWQALTVLEPRVVFMEYNATLGPTDSVSTVYDPTFDRFAKHPSGFYHGASLTALARLGARKGYALVGCDTRGVNAFFVRRTELVDALPELTPEQAFYPNDGRVLRAGSVEEQRRVIADLPLVEVEQEP